MTKYSWRNIIRECSASRRRQLVRVSGASGARTVRNARHVVSQSFFMYMHADDENIPCNQFRLPRMSTDVIQPTSHCVCFLSAKCYGQKGVFGALLSVEVASPMYRTLQFITVGAAVFVALCGV